MNGLQARFVNIDELGSTDLDRMLALMNQFYDNIERRVFEKDLQDKDSCIVLLDQNQQIQGFSTQKRMTVSVSNQQISGIFSGDTIIHKEHWGSLALHQEFAKKFIQNDQEAPDSYWFLISKGYKTYKFLPTFFREFYPRYDQPTPDFETNIMRAFGQTAFPNEYDNSDGVIHYHTIKDKLKHGVADIGDAQRKDPHIAFFEKQNPGHVNGDDLVCLAKLHATNLLPAARRILKL